MRYTLLTTLALLASTARAQEPVGLRALENFLGIWQAEFTDKPSLLTPAGAHRSGQQITAWTLKKRFTLGRDIDSDRRKYLTLITYDPKTNTYPSWSFNNRGLLGGQWVGTWDDTAKTLTTKATNYPPGFTGTGRLRYAGRDATDARIVVKDAKDAIVVEMEGKKSPLPEVNRERILAAWSKLDSPATLLSAESKVLERLVGNWDVRSTMKPAVWTPKEVRSTSRVSRRWILDGTLVQDDTQCGDGTESLALFGYDPQKKKYRLWYFNSDGRRLESTGDWDAAGETLSWTDSPEEGLTGRSTMKFEGPDRHVVKVRIADKDDRTYFDGEWIVTRRKE